MYYSAIIIGSGFSGLCMAIKLQEQGISNFIILEKAQEVGGTWRENTYPGAECDIPSALYSYSFEPYTAWEYKWSHQPQILEYLIHVCKKYNLYKHIKFGIEMIGAQWHEDEGIWTIKTNKSSFKCQSLISAIGQLHHPTFPKIKGQDTFKGTSYHSAQWNHGIDLKGKKVAVIGNAASAVQFIPEIAQIAESVHVFQRSSNWMLPKQDRLYKSWEKKLVRLFPLVLKLYRLRMWLLGGGLFFLMKKGNGFLRKAYEKQTVRYINKCIDDPELAAKLIPKYPMGAKRILFSDNYYHALNKKNVFLVTDTITDINENEICAKNDIVHNCDHIVYATGFRSNPFLLNLDIVGRGGITLKEVWLDEPVNYKGINVHHFPNLFIMYGPNTNLGHNSIVIMSEAQSCYISQCIKALETNDWKAIEIKKEAQSKYYNAIQKRLKEMVWSEVGDSWYKSANGNLSNNWPGRTMEYSRITRQVNFKDYDITR
ncbi:MAG: NAD(P)/FAD-dependent oxidoreductase [Saprospiraceae bacterium]